MPLRDLKININVGELAASLKKDIDDIQEDLVKNVKVLAIAAHAYGVELVNSKLADSDRTRLKSTRDKFLDNFKFETIADGVHVISVLEDALFIEEGLPSNFDMKPGLLNGPKAKTSKGGGKYNIVPFKHDQSPSKSTPLTAGLVNEVKRKLKKEGVPYKKLELNPDGSPKLGKLHTFDFSKNPTTMSWLQKKGQGHPLKGLSVYQTIGSTGKVRRDIVTFRTVSSSPKSRGKWIHPGMKGQKILDECYEWSLNQWENKILPELMKKWEMK